MSAKRTAVFAFLLIVILFQVIHLITRQYPSLRAHGKTFGLWRSTPVGPTHPIPKFMADAAVKYRALTARQSPNLAAAVAEYRKRYKRDPPKGFDEWYAFAIENGVKIIDEYDDLVEDISPFWKLSGEEFRRRVSQIGQLPSVDLVRLRNGTTVTLNIEKGFLDDEIKAPKVGGPRAKGFRVMMEKFQDKLPDMDFPINAKAEGRILVPWEHRMFPNMTQQNSSGGIATMLGGDFTADWRGDGNVWEAYRRICDPTSQARRLFDSIRSKLFSGTTRTYLNKNAGDAPKSSMAHFNLSDSFAERLDDNYDFCANPWAHYQQGNFFSDWRTIPVLYPILSPGKVRGFADIMIPSHYYYSSTPEYTYGWNEEKMVIYEVDESEVSWDEKKDTIFWRGSTTGGGSTPPGFLKSYQRHRFLEMVTTPTEATREVVFADPSSSHEYVKAEVPLNAMNEELIDAAFTKAVGCDGFPGGCTAMGRHYRFSSSVPLGEHWKHKYLLDIDGMGYSARSMAFLASESVIIKSTIYREFFSDWIQPWLHYIPLSQSYNEIYNIHAYFSGPSASMIRAANLSGADGQQRKGTEPSEGDQQLRSIAKAGREWKQTVGRKVDMETYVYRLCLEFARLYADDRDSMSYKA